MNAGGGFFWVLRVLCMVVFSHLYYLLRHRVSQGKLVGVVLKNNRIRTDIATLPYRSVQEDRYNGGKGNLTQYR